MVVALSKSINNYNIKEHKKRGRGSQCLLEAIEHGI